MELSDLKGIGPRRLQFFHAAGIGSLRDLFYTLPVKYRDASRIGRVMDCVPGEQVCLELVRQTGATLFRKGALTRVTCLFADGTGTVTAVWFNQIWMKKRLEKETHLRLFGTITQYGGQKQMINPVIMTENRIIPVYAPLEGIPQKCHENAVEAAFPYLEDTVADELPPSLCQRHRLMPLAEALRTLHRPPSMEAVKQAGRRVAFEQMLLYQVSVQALRFTRHEGRRIAFQTNALDEFAASLPFALTGAQLRTLREIMSDLSGGKAMTRMVQGDVGSGKTAVAMGTMFFLARNGYQSAMMVPTEILARQHYASMKDYYERLGYTCGLLLGGMKATERRKALEAIRNGDWDIVIGTHALISKGVQYARLALCVTDEQHRFGVAQRTALLGKGMPGEFAPHLLVMSATPIPRTMALILFGDLDISVIDELPPGRLPVNTRFVPEEKRKAMFGFVREELKKGHQAYFVCPLVEKTEKEDSLKSVREYAGQLQREEFPEYRIGMTWGTQASEEKAMILEDFSSGQVQILVSTTVIEVGVNVPNATLMVIENSDRFGLAQLHQLRGRVGRGSAQSWCFLLGENSERLRTLVKTNDGFEIANADLEQRGPGELLGTRQHGDAVFPGAHMAFGNMELLYEAASCAEELFLRPEYADEKQTVCQMAQEITERLSEKISLN